MRFSLIVSTMYFTSSSVTYGSAGKHIPTLKGGGLAANEPSPLAHQPTIPRTSSVHAYGASDAPPPPSPYHDRTTASEH